MISWAGGRSSWALLLLTMVGGGRVAVCRSVHVACVALEKRGNRCPVRWFVTEVVTLCVAHSCMAHGITQCHDLGDKPTNRTFISTVLQRHT